jgi:phosphatidylinositol alpha-1,6-mannosyltransferase
MPSTPPAGGLKPAEGFGIAYLEAAACGVPAIASSSGGGPEIVLEGVTGRLVDPDDDDQLKAALLELLKDRAESRAMGAKAREHVQRFDWRHGTDALEQVLRDVTANTR